jgi:hypothetical protein
MGRRRGYASANDLVEICGELFIDGILRAALHGYCNAVVDRSSGLFHWTQDGDSPVVPVDGGFGPLTDSFEHCGEIARNLRFGSCGAAP